MKQKAAPKLEARCLSLLSELCSLACTRLEELAASEPAPPASPAAEAASPQRRSAISEAKFVALVRLLPGSLLEPLIPAVVKSLAGCLRKNRSHRGLYKALECLPQPCLKSLDLGALFSEVRLYGQVNAQCKVLLRASLQRLPHLASLNLRSKCNDDILCELARSCPQLEELVVPDSDVTDKGLLALCGIFLARDSAGPSSSNISSQSSHGCFRLSRLNLQNCLNVTVVGVASLLRNLPRLATLSYDRLADAVEMVAKLDGDFLSGRRSLGIRYLDQFAEFYDFDAHPDVLPIVMRVCPRLESLRFYINDEGCKSLGQIGASCGAGVRHLQLEMEDVGNGFRLLTRQFSGLTSLQLTFHTMPFSQLIDIADNCPQLRLLRLIGFDVSESHNLVPHAGIFQELRVVDIRLVRHIFDPIDFGANIDEGPVDSQDTVTPQLLHFLLDHSNHLEEVTLEAGAAFFDERFLLGELLAKNPMPALAKLRVNVSPGKGLSAVTAMRVAEALPSLTVFGVSRWNVSSGEMRNLTAHFRKLNGDLTFV